MITIIIRTFVLYFTVLFSLRVMGKGELSKMDPFQMVILFMISELASLPIAEPDVSLIHGICAIATLLFLQILLSILSLKSTSFKTIVNGTPSILIDQGRLNHFEMKRLRISADDLSQQLRLKGYPSISDVDYAIMEINGDLSVIPVTQKQPLTPEQMNLTTEPGHLPVVLIADGVICHQNLRHAGLTELSLKEKLLELGVPHPDQIFIAFSDEHQKLTVYPKDSRERLLSAKGGDR
ncbi:MAG: DUF421 domain-containing protein [Firmicutes bacterium]|nr:DUF421 domain-containing protein [Bacillota bacterium]